MSILQIHLSSLLDFSTDCFHLKITELIKPMENVPDISFTCHNRQHSFRTKAAPQQESLNKEKVYFFNIQGK